MKYYSDFSLKNYNTFGMDVRCRRFVVVEDEVEVPDVISQYLRNEEFYILGGGSNVLFTRDFEGTIVHLQTTGISVVAEDDTTVQVAAAAGESWENFVNYCVSHGYYGVENLIGIPGLVGSSPVQNIGAYGAEVKDVIERVEGYYIVDGKHFEMSNGDCHFGYRNSIFKNELKNRCLITKVIFKL